MAVVWKVQDEVGHQPAPVVALQALAGLVAQGFLRVKLLALTEFHVFQQLLELQLTEVALHLHLAG